MRQQQQQKRARHTKPRPPPNTGEQELPPQTECRRHPPRRGASTRQAISARARWSPPPPWPPPPPRPPRRRPPSSRAPASPSSSGTVAAARQHPIRDRQREREREKTRKKWGEGIRGTRYLLPPGSEEIGAATVAAAAASSPTAAASASAAAAAAAAAPVIHAEEISSPGAAAVTRGREASTNPARPNPRRRRIAPRIGPGWRQSARSGGGWPRGGGRRRESRALGFGGRANTRRKEEIDAGKKNKRETEERKRGSCSTLRYRWARPGLVLRNEILCDRVTDVWGQVRMSGTGTNWQRELGCGRCRFDGNATAGCCGTRWFPRLIRCAPAARPRSLPCARALLSSPSLAHIGAARAPDSFEILQRCSSLCFFSCFQILQLSGFFRACLPPGRAPQLQLPLFASPACVGAWPPTAKIDPHAWLSGYARGRFLRAVHATHNGPLVSWRSGLLARLLNKWQIPISSETGSFGTGVQTSCVA
jgi:hypothetical protein